MELQKFGHHMHVTAQDDGYVHGNNTKTQIEMLKRLKNSQRGAVVAVSGGSSTGKAAFISEFLKGESTRHVRINAIELGNNDQRELCKLMRRAYCVAFKEQLRIVEGEVLSISSDKLTLKTVDMESVFDIGVKMKGELERERVCAGDIIKVYKDSGFITKVGKSSGQRMELQNSLVPTIEIPEGECLKTEVVQTFLSLDEIDLINFREDGEELLYTNAFVPKNLQEEVDLKVHKWIKEGKAVGSRGVVIVEDSHLLAGGVLSALLSYKYKEYCPLVILSGECVHDQIRPSVFEIGLEELTREKTVQIIKSRARYLDVSLDACVLDHLVGLSSEFGIKYAMQIMQGSASSRTVALDSVQKMAEMFGPIRSTPSANKFL